MDWIRSETPWLSDLLARTVLGNSVKVWVAGAIITIAAFFVLEIIKSVLKRKIHLVARFSLVNDLDKALQYIVESTRNTFLLMVAIFISAHTVHFSDRVMGLIKTGTILMFLYQVLIWGNYLIQLWIGGYAHRRMEDDAAVATTMKFATLMARIVFWSVLLLLGLDNVGVDVTALVTGLGVGGVAVALAAQNILGDLFASLSIVLDKPFVIGDFVTVGTDSGNIEKIGLKTTRVKSITGEQLIFSNNDLLQSRIRNFKRMTERRILFNFGVLYETPLETLKQIPGVVQEIIEGVADTRFDRSHFKGYGDSSIDFEVVYFVLGPEYKKYMDCQQTINLELFRRFKEMDVDFAYPTRTLYVNQVSQPQPQPIS